jgi:hypothetical protein
MIDWPEFTWDSKALAPLLSEVGYVRDCWLGRCGSIALVPGGPQRSEFLTEDTRPEEEALPMG